MTLQTVNAGGLEVAVIGSPSTNTHLTVDLLQDAIDERLVGALVAFEATQAGYQIVTVGQIVGIELKNRWHEDSVFRNLVKRTGEIPPITSRQDTRIAELVAGATFRSTGGGFEPDVLGMVPPTGTRVTRVTQGLLSELLAVYTDEIVYLGQAYGDSVLYPMWFKHFGSGPRGLGEAYSFGVFGRSGSGKSGLAKMLLLAYARHPEMSILVIDPQGEFSDEFDGRRVGQQGLAVDAVLSAQGRHVRRYRLSDIQLQDWEIFQELLLARDLLSDRVRITREDYRKLAADQLIEGLERAKIKLTELHTKDSFRSALGILRAAAAAIYKTAKSQQDHEARIDVILNQDFDVVYQKSWYPLAMLFAPRPNARLMYGIIDDLMSNDDDHPRPVVAIDLSEQANAHVWANQPPSQIEALQRRVINRLLAVIRTRASRDLQESANMLVVLDEAHRFAPAGQLDQGSQASLLRTTLRQAVRETRKYGLGWFFVSQTIGGIDHDLVKQLRVLFFGFGLALGSEFERLREFAGGDRSAMELYQSFRDPTSAPRVDLREFPFMAVGPVSPLAHAGKPIFFAALDAEGFSEVNKLAGTSASGVGRSDGKPAARTSDTLFASGTHYDSTS